VLTERVGGLPGLPEAFGARYDAPGRLTRGDIERAIVDAFPRLERSKSRQNQQHGPITRDDLFVFAGLLVLTSFAMVGVVAIIQELGMLTGGFL
jgi:hypothetical protein